MTEFKGKRYWLVGASQGLGEAVAHVLSAAGAEVILSARDAAELQRVASNLPGIAHVLPVDVTSAESVRDAAAELSDIDGVVYLAGAYWPMRAEQWDPEQSARMCEVNLTGALRVLGHVVPGMIERRSGHVVLTGSLAGFRGLPGAIGYGASKSGLMHLGENLRADLRGSGVRVQLINPGFIRTRLTEQNDFRMPGLMEPEAAGETFVRFMRQPGFSASYPFLFSLVFRLGRFLPEFLWARLIGAKH